MIATKDNLNLSPQEYFVWEETQELRHEYLDGKVLAMTGGSLVHADIALNIATNFRSKLTGQCKVRNSDAKVGILANGSFLYPDVSVSCDERDSKASKFISFPTLIVEVLSPSTEGYDRGLKFQIYRQLESLQYYVLVSSETQLVEVFLKKGKGRWDFLSFEEDDQDIVFEGIGVTMSLKEIYQDTILES